MNQIPNIEETHNTREVEEMVAQLLLRTYDRCFVRGRVPPEVGSSIAHYDLFLKEELANLLHHQLQKAREHELEVLAVHLDRQLVGYTSVSLDSIYRYIEERQKAIHSELDQDTDNDCPKHGNSEVAKQLFWEKPLTSHWGCRCKSELDQEVGITSEDKN